MYFPALGGETKIAIFSPPAAVREYEIEYIFIDYSIFFGIFQPRRKNFPKSLDKRANMWYNIQELIEVRN